MKVFYLFISFIRACSKIIDGQKAHFVDSITPIRMYQKSDDDPPLEKRYYGYLSHFENFDNLMNLWNSMHENKKRDALSDLAHV